MLDHLTGHIHVDVGVDATLPVIGRRRAIHRLRIQVQQGYLDYRQLESDLSTLEDALLDFSVRQGALVLELGIPLLPTRGKGKPLVRWPLDEPELELAQSRRLIRLSTLGRPARRPSTPPTEGSQPPGKPAIDLRALSLRDVNSQLTLEPAATDYTARVRRAVVNDLRVTGSAVHSPEADEQESTLLDVHVGGGEFTLNPILLGARQLRLSPLSLPSETAVRITLCGMRPEQLSAEVIHLELDELEFAPSVA